MSEHRVIRIGHGPPGRRRCPPWLDHSALVALSALLALALLAYGGQL